MLSVATGSGEFVRGTPIDPFLDSISSSVSSGACKFYLESSKPLNESEPRIYRDSESQPEVIEASQDLNAWVIHSRIRIFSGIPISDSESAQLSGSARFSDGHSIWAYEVLLLQDSESERITFTLTNTTTRGEQAGDRKPDHVPS